jgi:hypothetical protein
LSKRANSQSCNRNQAKPWIEAEDRLLRSHILTFIPEILIPGTKQRDDDIHRQFDGGLRVVRNSSLWFDNIPQIGGVSLLPLIMLRLKRTYAEAIEIGRSYNAAHKQPGASQSIPLDDDSDDERGIVASKVAEQLTEQCLSSLVDFTQDVPGYRYLVDVRGLPPSCWPDSVKWLPANVLRYGEGGVASLLYQDGVLAGVQVTHVDLDGNKSIIEPVRRTFRRDRKLRGATFGQMPDMATQMAMAKDPNAKPLLPGEGTEDWLSLRHSVPDFPSVGLPGIGALQHLRVAKGLRITIPRDGDAEDSPADRAVTAGIDALKLQDAEVSVTATPPGQDANSIMLAGGKQAVRDWVEHAEPAELSRDGEIERASRLPLLEYEGERKELAKRLGMRVPLLDDAVRKAQQKRARQQYQDSAEAPPRWIGTIDPDAACTVLLKRLERHIRAEKHKLVILVVWIAHTHLATAPMVNMPRSPRLNIASALPGSGKTTLHEMLRSTCSRAVSMSSTTGSAVFRLLGDVTELPTLLIDEGDLQLAKSDNDLLAVLNCGDNRATAVVRRSVKNPATGDFESVAFPAYAPACVMGLNDLPSTLEERSVRVVLRRATSGNRPQRLNKAAHEELADIGLHLGAWAATEPEWDAPDQELPWLSSQTARVADNWTILHMTGGRISPAWAELLKEAALATIGTKRQMHPSEQLLSDIHAVFEQQKKPDYALPVSRWPADCYDRIQSRSLLDGLLADPYSPWHRCNHGGRITYEWVSNRLATLLPDGRSTQWRAGKSVCRGYWREQFTAIWLECGIGVENDEDAPLYPFSHSPPENPPTPATATNTGDTASTETDETVAGVGNVAGVGGFEGGLKQKEKLANGGNGIDDADAIVVELIRREPGLSDAKIARKARRSPRKVAAVRAAMKAAEAPPVVEDPQPQAES